MMVCLAVLVQSFVGSVGEYLPISSISFSTQPFLSVLAAPSPSVTIPGPGDIEILYPVSATVRNLGVATDGQTTWRVANAVETGESK